MGSIFKEIYKYEDFIQNILFSNQNLLKLLSCNVVSEPLQQNNVDDPYSLLNQSIFFKPNAIDETTNTAQSFLFVNVETKAMSGSVAFVKAFIVFDILVHKSLNEIIVEDISKKRTREIIILLDESLNGKSILGNCQLEYESPLALNNKNYISRRLVYKLAEFSGFNYSNKG